MKPQNRSKTNPAFERLASQFTGLSFTDIELRKKEFVKDDPRNDERYVSGPAPPDVMLTGFEYLYEIANSPSVPMMNCMIQNHRHRRGAAFVFSDGRVRCVGMDCFAHLAGYLGSDSGALKQMLGDLRKRRASLIAMDGACREMSNQLKSLASDNFLEDCTDYDAFFYNLRLINEPAYSFGVKVASDNGDVLLTRQSTILNSRKIETYRVSMTGWEVFRSIPKMIFIREKLIRSIKAWISKYDSLPESISRLDVKIMRVEFSDIQNDITKNRLRLSLFRGFVNGDGIRHFVQLWNENATAGFELKLKPENPFFD